MISPRAFFHNAKAMFAPSLKRDIVPFAACTQPPDRRLVFTMLQPLDAVPISPCLARPALPLSIHSPRFLVQLPCA
jgi:hypothetical protein